MNIEEKFTRAKERNQERRAIYTYRFAVLLAFFAFINAIATLIYSRYNGIATWRTYTESGAILVFVGIAILQARQSRRNFTERNVFILIASFLGILMVRDIFLEGLGLIFGVAAVSITTTISMLTLSTRKAGFPLIAGYITSAVLILYDYYSPFERLPAPLQIRVAISTAAAAITIFAVFLVVRQFGKFSLYSKITALLSMAVLIPVVAIGAMNIISLRRELQTRQNEALIAAASQAAISLDTFIENVIASLRMEGQLPALSHYMRAYATGQDVDAETRKNALDTLRALARKDSAFIISYALLDSNGIIILDTDPNLIGENEAESEAFRAASQLGISFVSDVQYDDRDQAVFVFSAPIRDAASRPIGALRVRYKAYKLQTLMNEFMSLLGEDSFAGILSDQSIFLAHGRNSNLILKSAIPLAQDEIVRLQTEGKLAPGSQSELSLNLSGMAEGLANIQNSPVFYAEAYPKQEVGDNFAIRNNSLDTVAAVQIGTHHWTVIFSQPQQVYLNAVEGQTRTTILVAVIILVLTSISSLGVAQLLANPIAKLTRIANRIIEGDLSARADETSQDEIGILASTFNQMTNQLSESIGSLETRVAERTGILEKRATQLKAAAEIGRLAASLHSTDELLDQSVTLISEQFGFYHVGLFLLDERREFAVLRAANSQGGKNMLANNHKLRVGQVGIVGYVTSRGIARIALDVGEDATYFDNPFLPETRSEMALPFVAGGRVIGALDVQSTQAAAFTQDDITTLQVLADLLTIAIENARLFEESQKALSTTQSYFGELSQSGWKHIIKSRDQFGYLAMADGTISSVTEAWDETLNKAADQKQIVLDEEQRTAAIPIVVRGLSVGVIRLQKPENTAHWTKSDLDTAQALADQLSAALESARLYQDAQRRAMVEQAIGSIASRMDAIPEIEAIMKTAVEEIGTLIGSAKVSISLTPKADQILGVSE